MIENVNFEEHLFRCSSLGKLMTTARGSQITDKQREELDALLSKVKLTEKQAIRRDELVAKRDAPAELSATAKSYLREVLLEKLFGRVNFMQNKYTEKGTLCENEGVTLANRVLGWNLNSQEIASLEFSKQRVNNNYITGEMDVNMPNLLADIKCPWDIFTFPFFAVDIPDKDYYWQLQGYMWLTGHKRAELVYTLVDAPEHMIADAQRRREWQMNVIDLPEEVNDQIRHDMTFDDIPEELRVKRWIVERDDAAISDLKEAVKLARNYLTNLQTSFLNLNKDINALIQ